ncbi:MAG: LPS export ABC transporter periplasmic protein LptC [Pseudomonadales bacterium]|nr:LPS export ABC transporter periplasmic protein LptC [Pseudomonadales bacterium]
MFIRRQFSRRRTYAAFLGLVLIALIFIINDTHFARTAPPFLSSSAQGEESPDTEIQRFSNTVFDQNGQLKYTLNSPHLFHYSHNDLTLLSAPKIKLYEKNKTPWHVTAKQGTITKTDEITLNGDVEIHGNTTQDKEPVTVKTNVLTLFTNEKRAESTAYVNIYSKQSQLSGTGLKADMISSTITLLSQVAGSYRQSDDQP